MPSTRRRGNTGLSRNDEWWSTGKIAWRLITIDFVCECPVDQFGSPAKLTIALPKHNVSVVAISIVNRKRLALVGLQKHSYVFTR